MDLTLGYESDHGEREEGQGRKEAGKRRPELEGGRMQKNCRRCMWASVERQPRGATWGGRGMNDFRKGW